MGSVGNIYLAGDARISKDTVERLEEVLEMAKKGQVISVAIAFVCSDGCTGNALTYDQPVTLLGESLLLQKELSAICDTRHYQGGY